MYSLEIISELFCMAHLKSMIYILSCQSLTLRAYTTSLLFPLGPQKRHHFLLYMNSMQTCNSLTIYFMKKLNFLI